MAVPAMNARPPERAVADLTSRLDAAVAALNQAAANKDWPAVEQHAASAARFMETLNAMGAAAPILASTPDPSRVDELRDRLRAARESMRDARTAAFSHDAARLEAATQKFEAAYQPIRAAAATSAATTRPTR
jgi:hypothetical protein